MELREIKALLALMRDFGLSELEIEDKKGKVRLVRAANSADERHTAAAGAPRGAVRAAAKVAAGLGGPVSDARPPAAPELGPGHRYADPFVEEGDSVRKGTPLCIIEAMKMMNEIEAEIGGKVVRILCENGQPVEYGQPLMVIEAG
jgi:acetyl-CoA carboxylase biotin carboxyl carrier protein